MAQYIARTFTVRRTRRITSIDLVPAFMFAGWDPRPIAAATRTAEIDPSSWSYDLLKDSYYSEIERCAVLEARIKANEARIADLQLELRDTHLELRKLRAASMEVSDSVQPD